MKVGRFLTFLLGIMVLSVFSSLVLAQEDKEEVFPQVSKGEEAGTYTLGKGDVVEITVRNQPEFSGQFAIGPDGNIQYKFVGDIKAEGLTKEELKEFLTKKLERYVKVPEVSVSIVAYRSNVLKCLEKNKWHEVSYGYGKN